MMREAFDRRRQTMWKMLDAIPGVSCLEPEGAFYAYPKLTGLLGKDIRGRTATDTLELATIILEEAKVAIVPGEAFGTSGYARLSFALGDDDLAEGVQRIADLVADASVTPYGEWPSPISAELVVTASASLGEVVVDGDDVHWSELRPTEGGRVQIVRRGGGVVRDLLPDGFSARTRVHEYGGAAWTVSGGLLVFNNWDDQRLYALVDGDDIPSPLTPEPPSPFAFRHADLQIVDGHVLCVRERHDTGGEAANEIVAVALDGSGRVDTLVSGPDFVSDPRVGPDGATLAWVEWDHPDMPWDSTRVQTASLTRRGGRLTLGPATLVAGGPGESVIMPRWSTSGVLHVVSDRSDWWNVHVASGGGSLAPITPVAAEVGTPPWVFGMSRYVLLADGSVVFAHASGGIDQLSVRAPDGVTTTLDLPYTELASLAVRRDSVVLVGAAFDREPAVVEVSVGDGVGRGPSAAARRRPRSLVVLDRRAHLVPIRRPYGARPLLPADQSRRRPARGGCTSSARADTRRPHGDGPWAAGPGQAVLDQPWLRRRRRELRGLHRIRTGLSRAAEGAVGDRRRRGLHRRRPAPRITRPRRPRTSVHPRRIGGWLHGARRPDTRRHVRSRRVLVRRRRPHRARPRRPTSSSRATSTASSGPYPAAKAVYEERSPLSNVDRLDRPLIVFQGLEDEIVPPNQSEMIVDALRTRGCPGGLPRLRGRATRIPAIGDGHPGARIRAGVLRPRPGLHARRRRSRGRDPQPGLRCDEPSGRMTKVTVTFQVVVPAPKSVFPDVTVGNAANRPPHPRGP